MPPAKTTTTATAMIVPHGVGRPVTTEARAPRTALLFLPLTIDRPTSYAHPGAPRVVGRRV